MVARHGWPALAAVGLIAGLLLGCGAPASAPTASPALATTTAAPTPGTSPQPSPMARSYDVGGRELFMTCSGTGAPTIVYLHGGGTDSSGAGPVADMLDDRFRVCRYDRANMGMSGDAPGPLTGQTSIEDLHALLDAAQIPGPHVLLGGSFGGLISYMYAVTYPEDVVGMVLLDPSLPEEVSRIDDVVVPPRHRIPVDAWKTSPERLDALATYRQAEALLGKEPAIPIRLLVPSTPDFGSDVPPDLPTDDIARIARQLQDELVARFGPGSELIEVDSPHFMEGYIPYRVAEEVTRLIEDLP